MDKILFIFFIVCTILSFLGVISWIFLLIKFRFYITQFIKRRRHPESFIESTIINENGQLTTTNQDIGIDKEFIIGGDRYIVDKNCVIYRKNLPKIYHFKGNPNPLNFRSHNIQIDVSSENYNNLMKQKLIRDLLVENNLMMYILIISVVGCVIGLAVAFKVYDVFKKVEGKK